MKDWNKMKLEEHIDHLENKFRFDSSGTAKSVFELIAAYRALIISNFGVRSEQLPHLKTEFCKKCKTNTVVTYIDGKECTRCGN